VLIYVPAVQAAYGPLDAELGHHRRYSKRTLAAAFAAAGLDLLRLRYANAIGLIGWMYNARVTKTRHHSLDQVKAVRALRGAVGPAAGADDSPASRFFPGRPSE
jgi:hypothetical protein